MATATLPRPSLETPATAKATPSRLGWVDYAKGIGIVLVIFGHVWRGLKTAEFAFPAGLFERVDTWIYAFHMPLFFFLSGLFAGRAADRPAGSYLVDKLSTIAYPYVLWSLIQGGVNLVLSRHTNRPLTASGLLEAILFRPYAQFWFLYALLIQFVAFLPLRKLRLDPRAILVVAIAVPQALKLAAVPLPPIVGVALDFFGYFALGHTLHGWLSSARMTPRPSALLGLAALAATLLALGAAGNYLERPGIRVVAALVGIAGTLAASCALERLDLARILMTLGRASMPIFVAHVLATAACRMALAGPLHVRNLPIHLVLGTIAGLAFPLLLERVARRIGVRFLFALKG